MNGQTGTITWVIGDLDSGDSLTFTVTARVQTSVGAGVEDVINTVVVSDDGANGGDPTPGDNTGSDTNTIIATPDYVLTKENSGDSLVPGETTEYTISVTNAGDQGGTGVVVNDTFPVGIFAIVTAADGGVVDMLAGTIDWNIGGLEHRRTGSGRNAAIDSDGDGRVRS